MPFGRLDDRYMTVTLDWRHRGPEWATAEEIAADDALVERLEAEGWIFEELTPEEDDTDAQT